MSARRTEFSGLAENTLQLFRYCRERDWAGHDPYDALNSRLFKSVPLLDFRLPRLVLTQALKRLPINFRSICLVPPTQNPKALALFLQAALKLGRLGLIPEDGLAERLAARIGDLKSNHPRFCCWGYSFPWQTRTRLVPAGAPNLVCTTFVADALLDLYQGTADERWLAMALSAANFLVSELFWAEGEVAAFSYPFASSRVPVHNANLLAAAFLARVWKHTGNKTFLDPALKAAIYSMRRQKPDGSWDYGESPKQRWIDNFHTGYNLCALEKLSRITGRQEFGASAARGFEFYRKHFFLPDGAPKYFHNRVYPLDVHSVAQSLITLSEFKHLDDGNESLMARVYEWAVRNLRDERGFFYYQKLPFLTNKIPYMRWGQAWMLLAQAQSLEGRQKPRVAAAIEEAALAK